jgi:uncharacterized membrane protein
MEITTFHGRLGTTALYYCLFMGLWALWRFIRRQPIDSSYWGATWIGEGLILVQGALGMFLWLSGRGQLEGQTMHILYGVVAALVIPGVFFYTQGSDTRRTALVYGAGFLFLFGILLRGIGTAPA